MSEQTYTVTLKLLGPILTQGAAAAAPGIDAPMAVTQDGHYCLPWSLVRGRMRQSLEELRGAAGADAIPLEPADCFGTEPDKAAVAEKSGNVLPNRGRISVGDFASSLKANSRVRHRIAISSETRAVKKGALMVMEAPFATGQEVPFTGKVRVFLPENVNAVAMGRHLQAIFRWATAFGGQRIIGFGRLVGAEVQLDPSAGSTPAAAVRTGHTRLAVTLKPEAPFCFAWHKTSSDNLYQSRHFIPGAAIKGAVAERWRRLTGKGPRVPVREFADKERAELAAHFDGLVFRDAFPTVAGKSRAPVIPASAVRIRQQPADQPFYDVALCDGPRLIGGDAPAFSIDWKYKDTGPVQKHFGIASPRTLTRLRNGMDRDTLRTEDEKLFAQELVAPCSADPAEPQYDWRSEVDASYITDPAVRAKVLTQLADLMGAGLSSLGKTKVWAQTTLAPTPTRDLPEALGGGLYVVTLQTAALLADPFTTPGPATARDMHSAYNKDWTQLSGGSLSLVRHFGRQSLAGGYYLHSTFRKGKPYNPWLLTDPGAVFVLRVEPGKETTAHEFLTKALRAGLPLPDWARTRYGHTWRECPFLPENGYGEIAVNQPCHTEFQPPHSDSDVITVL